MRGVEGACFVFTIYDEPESPDDGACFVFTIHNEPESPTEGACLR